MKGVQDMIAQMKQMKIQTNSIRKPRIIDHNEIIVVPIEDNNDDRGETSSNQSLMLTKTYMPRQVLL